MTTKIHRVTPDSRAGRSMVRVGRDYDPSNLSAEVREWNAEVEKRKRDKLERKITKATTTRDPVHYHAGAWWFYDETWDDAIGPYDQEFLARAALEEYCKKLNTPKDATVSV